MSERYPIVLPGFDGREIFVQSDGGIALPKLFVDGLPAPPGGGKGKFVLRRNDETEMTAYFKNGFPDTIPVLVVGDQTVRYAPPLQPFEWAWAALPLLLVFIGGAIGGGLGAMAFTFNTMVFRSKTNGFLKYILCLLITIAAIIVWWAVTHLFRH